MKKKQIIVQYFDSVSSHRDSRLDDHVIIRYEQRVRQEMVVEMLQPSPGDLLLDLGCGNGRDLRIYAQLKARAVGIDFSIGMLTDARRELSKLGFNNSTLLVQGDGIQLPFPDNTFDKLACSEVIEHIPDFVCIFPEIRRVLKPCGLFVITTPNLHSLYGLYKRWEERWVASKFRIRWARKNRTLTVSRHPYDEWKTSKQLINSVKGAGLEVSLIRGICYIPSHFTYKLPRIAQRTIVAITQPIERPLSRFLPANGYSIAVLGHKI